MLVLALMLCSNLVIGVLILNPGTAEVEFLGKCYQRAVYMRGSVLPPMQVGIR